MCAVNMNKRANALDEKEGKQSGEEPELMFPDHLLKVGMKYISRIETQGSECWETICANFQDSHGAPIISKG